MKVDHTFAMTDGFSSISEGFFMDRIIWNIIFHMKNNYYFLMKNAQKSPYFNAGMDRAYRL